jgi:hypothetical protein
MKDSCLTIIEAPPTFISYILHSSVIHQEIARMIMYIACIRERVERAGDQ